MVTKSLLLACWMAVSISFTSLGQTTDETATLLRFRDSVRHVLQNIQARDITIVSKFDTMWSKLTIQQKKIVKRQSQKIWVKQYLPKTNIEDYYGSIVYATLNNSGLIDNYVAVAERVIDRRDKRIAANFFSTAHLLFKEQVLHIDKLFQLHLLDATYKFDYVEDAATIPLEDNEDRTSSNDGDGDWEESFPDADTDNEVLETDEPTDVLEDPIWATATPLPEAKGPVLRFDRVTFRLTTPYDSVFLKNTAGVLSFVNNTFIGEGGSFDWSSVGLSSDSVFFEFKGYSFNIAKSIIEGERGYLTYRGKLPTKTMGNFEFESKRHGTPKQAQYPRFTSFRSNIKWSHMPAENLRYVGGFALDGETVRSRSVSNDNAKLEILGENNIKVVARAQAFDLGDSIITSQDARVAIHRGLDSIYHPSVLLWYEVSSHKLVLKKSHGRERHAAYSSPYLKVDFTADKLQWDMRSDSMSITADGGRGQNPMILESVNFYDPEDFRILTGYGFRFHPLILVVDYSLHEHTREFYVTDLAQGKGQKFQDVHRAMEFLDQKGMVEYNMLTGMITVKEKAINIFKARKGDVDYDNLKIHSVTDGKPNAIFSLQDNKMQLNGVDEFNVSDSLNVMITPDNNAITLQKDRSMQFDGKVSAGNFEIFGSNCAFRYDSFLIYLNHIDSIQLYVTETNERGQKIRRKVNNTVQGVDSTNMMANTSNKKSGTLFISRPDNKSGREKTPNYPRLDVSTGGIIYFDRKEILNGAYDRSIFYILPPFKLDSLDDADPATIRFDGKFIPGGIFPPFQQEIYTRPDKSLGFKHSIPSTGYSTFGGLGNMTGVIDLSSSGIRVSGELTHLNAKVKSNDFICYPDSIVGLGYTAKLHRQQIGSVQYPDIQLPSFRLKWIPSRDWFKLSDVDVPFSLYKSSAKLQGSILLSKTGVSGKGKLSTHGFDAESEDFSFHVDDFDARHAYFKLNTAIPNKPAITGKDVHLQFYVVKNYANISPEMAGDAALEFPYAQFKTSIPEAIWDLNTKKVTMEKAPNMPLEESYFYTTRPDLDSLNFMGEAAEYDVERQTLQVTGIPYIKVSDAKIIPESHKILILENARIGTLKHAEVIVDTLNEYHHLIDGTITIFSRKKFSGRATYQYVNVNNDTFAIKMTDFRVEPINNDRKNIAKRRRARSSALEETVASGVVTEADSLILFPRIFYKGNMTMYATRPSLQLEGSIKLDLRKIKDYDTWINYQQSGDEEDISLDFTKAETERGKHPNAGLHFASNDSLYATFTFDKKNVHDEDFFLPKGSLFYNHKNKEFHIENRSRASGDQFSGTAFIYNEDKQEVKFAGPIYFFGKNTTQKNFSLVATALGSNNLEMHTVQMNALLMLNPHIPSQALLAMATDLQAVVDNADLGEGLGDQTELLYKIADIVGENAVEKFELQSVQAYTSLATIPQLAQPLLFANVDMKRSTKHKAFYSTGMLGLSNILNQDINSNLEGFVEARMNEDGSPVFQMFFRASPYSWYYFGLEDDRLLVYSSNKKFNMIIGKKANTGATKMGGVTFAQGSTEEALEFINRFRRDYYDIDTPFQMDSPLPKQQGDP